MATTTGCCRRRAILAALAALCTSAAAARAHGLPDESERWIEVSSGNFTIHTNAGAARARSVARELETLRAVLAQVATGFRLDSLRRTIVHVFDDEESFRPYLGTLNGKPRSFDGYFLHGVDANHVAMNANARTDTRGICYHEFLHEVLDRNFDTLPLWFEEGLAEFYRTFTSTEKEAAIGRPNQEHIRWLRANALIPLKQLFAVTHDSPEYNEEAQQGVFYAESWALVHYLLNGSVERRPQVARFLALVGSGGEPDASFREAFHDDYGALETELRAYVKRDSFSYSRVGLEKIQLPPLSEPRPLERAEVLYRLGNLLLGAGRESDLSAETHFRGVLAVQPAHAGALAGLGAIRTRQGRYDEAAAYLEKAVEHDPRDATICHLYASNLILQATGGVQEGFAIPEEPPPAARLARATLSRCLELDPRSAEALADYGLTFLLLRDEDVSPGVAALEKARRMLSRDDILMNLVVLYVVQGDRARAQALVDGALAATGKPDLQRRARDALVALDLEEARRLYESGEVEKSLELLRRLSARAGNPQIKNHVDGLVAQVEAALARKTEIDAYNAALDLIRSGSLAAAKERLKALAATCKDRQVCEEAQSLLADLTKRK